MLLISTLVSISPYMIVSLRFCSKFLFVSVLETLLVLNFSRCSADRSSQFLHTLLYMFDMYLFLHTCGYTTLV